MNKLVHRASGFVFSSLLCAGCGNSGMTAMNSTADTCMTGMEKATVLTKVAFARQNPPGVTLGFDLDHYVATKGDDKTCGHASLKAPDGTPGIDNALSAALPAIDAQTKGALDGELQDAINSGMLLVGADITHLDDRMNDGCVDLTFSRLTGKPTVGTDGVLDANQTFDTDKMFMKSMARGAVKNGVLEVGPMELALPVRILDANFTLNVHNAHVRFNIGDDASLSGVLGGTLSVNEVVTTLEMYAIGAQLKMMLPDLLNSIADMDKDPSTGMCRQFSVAMTFSAKSAFINP